MNEAQRSEESGLTDLLSAGQIKEGDKLKITYKGERINYVAEEILNAGTDKEEIILHVDSNLYFITSMALDGTSWAKDVKIAGR